MYIVLRKCKSIPAVSWWRDLSVYKWPIPNNVTILAPYTCAASSPFASPSFSSRLYKCWGKFNKKKSDKQTQTPEKQLWTGQLQEARQCQLGVVQVRSKCCPPVAWGTWWPADGCSSSRPAPCHEDDEDAAGDGDGDRHGHGHGIVNFLRPGTGDDD